MSSPTDSRMHCAARSELEMRACVLAQTEHVLTKSSGALLMARQSGPCCQRAAAVRGGPAQAVTKFHRNELDALV